MKRIIYKIYKEYPKNNINNSVITFDKSATLTLSKQTDIIKFDCCNSNKKAGCLIRINESEIYVCHIHLFKLLDLFTEIINKMNNLINSVVEININGLIILGQIGNMIYFRRRILNYLYEVYKEHTEDKLFHNQFLSGNQKYVISIFQTNENIEINPEKFISSFSQGEYQQYLLKKRCLNKLQDCVNYNKRLQIPQEIALDNPVYSLNVICSFRDINCKTSKHLKEKDAVIIINTYRKDTFSFSFCADCLYGLYAVLKGPYLDDQLEEFVYDTFKVLHKTSNDYCFLTGIKEERMYEIFINNVSFVLCKSSYNMLFETIVCSSAFKELYPLEAKKFVSLFEEEHSNQINRLKKELNDLSECSKRAIEAEKNLCKKRITEITSYYENLFIQNSRKNEEVFSSKDAEIIKLNQELQKLNNTINNLKHYNESLKESNSHYQQKLNDFDLLYNEEKIRIASKYQDRIINCQNQKSIINLNLASKIANQNIMNDINITYIYGIKCSTLNHYPKQDLIALLECAKKNEVLYLALCPVCVDILLCGLNFIERKKENYIDDRYKLSIVFVTEKDNSHCKKCKNKNSKQVKITLDNVQFQMCTPCVKKFKLLLQGIKAKFELINSMGGYKFFNSDLVNLRID